jgi:hypothetical protein
MIWTDGDTFRFDRESGVRVLVLTATLTNEFRFPLYVVRCRTSALVSIEKHTDDSWQTAYQPGCDLLSRAITVVNPGKRYVDVKRIALGPWYPRFTVTEIAGVYRARYDVYRQYKADPSTRIPVRDPAAEEARITNEFKIVEP